MDDQDIYRANDSAASGRLVNTLTGQIILTSVLLRAAPDYPEREIGTHPLPIAMALHFDDFSAGRSTTVI